MRRIDNKQNLRKHPPRRMMSHNNLHQHHPQFHQHPTTIAEINKVSHKHHKRTLDACKPYRIILPDYFNIPKFEDKSILERRDEPNQREIIKSMRNELEVRRKLKDLQILAEGMRRAKNIKQQSRYYYTQGVLLHNNQLNQNSICYFQKFLKIVLFIKDQKSVELALNTIGIEYMLLKNYSKAIEYHKKQAECNARADQFISHINQGLCYELSQVYESALNLYSQAEEKLKLEGDEQRKKYVRKMIERVEAKVKNLFITNQQISKELERQENEARSPSKNTMKRSVSLSRLRDEQKVGLAISFAQQKMESFMQQMKNSFLIEKQ